MKVITVNQISIPATASTIASTNTASNYSTAAPVVSWASTGSDGQLPGSESSSFVKRKLSTGWLSNKPASSAIPVVKSDIVSFVNSVQGVDFEDTLLSLLHQLFIKISNQRKKTGSLAPSAFLTKLKQENELFNSTMHQDAHEFLNYLLNAVAEILTKHQKEFTEKLAHMMPPSLPAIPQKYSMSIPTIPGSPRPASWIHELFEGILINETKCLTCDTITSKDESFLDLSVDIEQHTSLSSCLRNFSSSEILCAKNKFFCDSCGSLQEAEKRMKVKKLPNILALHLKRFKYQEDTSQYVKLSHRVVFPMTLRLFNTSSCAEDADRLYTLSSIIIHIGNGPYHGHYISLVKSEDGGVWIVYDDDHVQCVNESELVKYFGDLTGPGTGYIFLYQADGWDAKGIVEEMKVPGEQGEHDVDVTALKRKKSLKDGTSEEAKEGWWPFGKKNGVGAEK